MADSKTCKQRIRIATWNLERPKKNGLAKNQLRMEKIQKIDADIWILTETNAAITIPGYECLPSLPQPNYHVEGENYTTIWSRWPILRSIPTFDPYFAICAEIDTPVGSLLIYGTIITYFGDRGSDGKSPYWEEHRKSITAHATDWQRLREQYTNHTFCLAGDFNQSRDDSGWPVDRKSVGSLTSALNKLSIKCLTEMDMRANGLSRASIDHICLSTPMADRVSAIGAWEGILASGRKLSDHNGIFVDIEAQADVPANDKSTINFCIV